MIGLIIFIAILPYLYGKIILCHDIENVFLRIPVGVMIELLIWTVCSLPVELLNYRFSIAKWIFVIVNIIFVLYYIYKTRTYMSIRNRCLQIKKNVKEYINYVKSSHLKKISFILMLFVIGFQAGRASFFQYAYGDNRVYVAMINDMVETDRFYPYVDETGAVYADVPKKYLLSSWYTFETVIAELAGVKPLFLVYTVFPAILILFIYLIWWELADFFFKGKITDKSVFIIILAFLLEINAEDVSSYVLYWPTYGKSITAEIVMPLFVLLWIYNSRNRQFKNDTLLTFLMAAGCAASTMGVMIMPLEAGVLTVIDVLNKKKLTREMVLRLGALLMPIIVYVVLFIS